jgi:adenylyltransferase/sulfurtransferase
MIMFSQEELLRYKRQLDLDGFGMEAQERLRHSKVLFVGAGGLSSGALQYLCAAGAGAIGIADGDKVEPENLHRQVLYDTDDIGFPKSEVAAGKLRALNPFVKIISYPVFLEPGNVKDILSDFDLIIDGSDRINVRYLINDACLILGKPWIYASVYKHQGQLTVFNAKLENGQRGPDYRSLFSAPDDTLKETDCNMTGVLGIVPGMLGILQASEAIKLLTGTGKILSGRLFTIDFLNMRTQELAFERNEQLIDQAPRTMEILKNTDYGFHGLNQVAGMEISCDGLEGLLSGNGALIVDLRRDAEAGKLQGINMLKREMEMDDSELKSIPPDKQLVLVCQRGVSAREKAYRISQHFPSLTVRVLKGGALAWNEFQKSKQKGNERQ